MAELEFELERQQFREFIEPTQAEIAALAYRLWDEEGRRPNCSDDYWHHAKAYLTKLPVRCYVHGVSSVRVGDNGLSLVHDDVQKTDSRAMFIVEVDMIGWASCYIITDGEIYHREYRHNELIEHNLNSVIKLEVQKAITKYVERNYGT